MTLPFKRKFRLVTIRQLSIHGNVWTSFWWPDVLPDVSQLRLGKICWNLPSSSAEIQFCLHIELTCILSGFSRRLLHHIQASDPAGLCPASRSSAEFQLLFAMSCHSENASKLKLIFWCDIFGWGCTQCFPFENNRRFRNRSGRTS